MQRNGSNSIKKQHLAINLLTIKITKWGTNGLMDGWFAGLMDESIDALIDGSIYWMIDG